MKTAKRRLGLLAGLAAILSVNAQTEVYCTQDMYSSENLLFLQKPTDSTISPNTGNLPVYVPFTMYDPCANRQNNLRGVAYVHGLGGSIAAWDKQIQFTDSEYDVACFGVDYGSGSYEVSFFQVGQRVQGDLKSGFQNADAIYTIRNNSERCQNDDYVIAHSQGGIAARYLDWKWNMGSNSFGTREFYGLVTFGTPHSGAHVAFTKEEHYGFVAEVISTIILYEANEMVYDLTGSFAGTFIGNKVYDLRTRIDTLIKYELAPLMLSSVHWPTLDSMAPGSPMMTDLNNHWGKLHRVAFYGVEDEPECWRVMDQVVTKGAEEYPLWGAQPDEELMQKMEMVRAIHTLKIQENEDRMRKLSNVRTASWFGPLAGKIVIVLGAHLVLNRMIQNMEKENEQRAKSVEFLDNANTYWRYLIGSYHRDSFEVFYDSIYNLSFEVPYGNTNPRYGTSTGWRTARLQFSTYEAALRNSVGKRNPRITGAMEYRRQRLKFYPSDGVVLAQSQMAFPGIDPRRNIDYMEHNNHFQERNSSETERVLKLLFNGGQYDEYFILNH